MKRNEGFTLVELVVSIATASIVLAAASAFLLMATRTQRDIRDAAQEQQTVRIVMTMLENLATEGSFDSVKVTDSGWTLQKEAASPIITYANGTLSASGSALLEDLNTAHAELNGQLLNFTFETDLGSYSSSVYCRLINYTDESAAAAAGDIGPIKDKITASGSTAGNVGLTAGENEADKRFAFLQTLCKEYGSTGQIKNPYNSQTFDYYSEWYIGDYSTNPGWNSSTPWCACFLSWATAQHLPRKINDTQAPYIFADVDDGWKHMTIKLKSAYTPIPGDYIFFDWEGNDEYDKDHGDADHVGVVLYVNGTTIYTIEGNSGGRVAIRSYLASDPRIMGYGVLPWA